MIQRNVKHFFKTITANAVWEEAVDEGVLDIPILDDWEDRQFQTHVVPLRTRPGQERNLSIHLLVNNINAYPMAFPIVPKGESRVRLAFHAHNTLMQVEKLAMTICKWAAEMFQLRHEGKSKAIPTAARQYHTLQGT